MMVEVGLVPTGGNWWSYSLDHWRLLVKVVFRPHLLVELELGPLEVGHEVGVSLSIQPLVLDTVKGKRRKNLAIR
jgi:hypothetical protein